MTIRTRTHRHQGLLSQLEDLPEDFYLTGSRFFRTERPGSDWDFFTADSPKVRASLSKMGFVEELSPSYWDGSTAAVYVHQRGGIHVQLLMGNAEVERKLAVHKVLDRELMQRPGSDVSMFILHTLGDKRMAKNLWTVLLAVAREVL